MKFKINKNKLFFLLIIFSAMFLWTIAFAQRVPEVTYPVIVPGVSPPTGQMDIGGYIRYVYVSLIALGGILTLGVLIWGGFKFLTSTGNPAAMADARETILYGIIGLLILLGSFVLLREINPQLIAPFVPSLKTVGRGIIVYSDQDCGGGANGLPGVFRPLPEHIRYERVETIKKLANESISIQSFWAFNPDTDILVEFYSNSDCKGGFIRRVPAPGFRANTCVHPGTIQNVKCIKLIWHSPGAHLFTEEGARIQNIAPGTSRWDTQNSAGSLPAGINNQVRTLALTWNAKTDVRYGAILQREAGPMNVPRGWSVIFLPDPWESNAVASNVFTDNDLHTTYYDGPRWQDASSITLFQVVPQEADDWWIQVCRNVNCEPNDMCPGIIRFFPWRNEWRRANWQQQDDTWVLNWDELHNANFIIDGLSGEIVRGINLFEDTDGFWCGSGFNNGERFRITTTVPGTPDPNGVSAIKIHAGAQGRYIVTLHAQPGAGDNPTVAHDPSLITSVDIDALNEVGFDDRTAAIRIIKGIIQ